MSVMSFLPVSADMLAVSVAVSRKMRARNAETSSARLAYTGSYKKESGGVTSGGMGGQEVLLTRMVQR